MQTFSARPSSSANRSRTASLILSTVNLVATLFKPGRLRSGCLSRSEVAEANRYLREHYRPTFNAEFMEPAAEQGSCFVPLLTGQIDDILCEHHERTVGRNNCISFEGITLQIPHNQHRCNYINAKIRVHRYPDGSLAIFHGPRKLANYHHNGNLKEDFQKKAA